VTGRPRLKTRASYDLLARLHYGLPAPSWYGYRDLHGEACRMHGLRLCGAIDSDGQVTDHGRRILKFQAERMASWHKCANCRHLKPAKDFGQGKQSWCLECKAENRSNRNGENNGKASEGARRAEEPSRPCASEGLDTCRAAG